MTQHHSAAMTAENQTSILRDFGSHFEQFNAKNVLVTGGTGSFGQMFCKLVLTNAKPERLIVFSRDELKQYEMAEALEGFSNAGSLRFFIGDVRDLDRLEMAFRDVDFVIHAAALKQVPTAEYNPFECVHTNVFGAENVVRACLRTGVERVIALSTDKAASPSNLYGASKLASDKIFVAANHLAGLKGTIFSVVRYGNVIGSRGSVVPMFRRLIEKGAQSLPITDPRMTRFWVTLGQGVNFVCASLEKMSGGEIFVPKIASVRMIDLARIMAPDLNTHIIGIRPGEKLHEVMITEDDARMTFEQKDSYIIRPPFTTGDRSRIKTPGTPVDEGFRYASNTNPEQLNEAGLRQLLSQVEC